MSDVTFERFQRGARIRSCLTLRSPFFCIETFVGAMKLYSIVFVAGCRQTGLMKSVLSDARQGVRRLHRFGSFKGGLRLERLNSPRESASPDNTFLQLILHGNLSYDSHDEGDCE